MSHMSHHSATASAGRSILSSGSGRDLTGGDQRLASPASAMHGGEPQQQTDYRGQTPPASAGYAGSFRAGTGPDGFRNIRPRTRAERRQQVDKETLERSRLKQRRGGFHNYIDYGKNLTAQAPGSCGFIPEAERFVTDAAAEEKLEREQAAARKAQVILRRREENSQREENRWKRMEEQKEEEQQRWDALRESGSKAFKNKESVPYDMITLSYNDTKDGMALKYSDEQVMYRAALRAKHLDDRMHGSQLNPLTGDERPSLSHPSPPVPPPGIDPRHPLQR